jgi:hypothetical protein
MGRVVLQVGPVDQELSQQARPLADFDVKRRLNGLDRRHGVVRRADAANAARDQWSLVEAPADDHRLEQTRGLDDVHSNRRDRSFRDFNADGPVTLDTRHMFDRQGRHTRASSPSEL